MSESTLLPIASGRQSWRAVGGMLWKRWGSLLGASLLTLAGSASALAVPALLGMIVDAVIERDAFARVLMLGGGVAVAGIVAALLVRWGGGMLVRCLQSVLAELREEVLAAAVRLDQGTVEDAGTSDVVSRVTGDVEAITDAVSDVLPRFVQAGFTIVLTFVGLAALDPRLALAALVAVPVQVVMMVLFLRRSRPLYRRVRREEAARGQAIIEAVRGANTVVAHQDGARHLRQVSERSLAAVETGREAAKARNIFNGGLNGAEYLGLAAVLAVGFWLSMTDGLSVGAVTAAALFFHRLFDPVGSLLSSIDDLQRAAAGLGRLVGVLLARPSDIARTPATDASIRVRDARYRYRDDAPEALLGVDLDVPAGQTVVLVGASGSGKSTLAQLIAGVFKPTAGDVLIGGAPAVSAGDDRSRAVLLVTQDTHVFSGTLADNLRLADPSASDDAVRAALREVGADWFVGMEHDIDTEVGHTLDDARLQQIALARVLLANPPVVVLDEATAHADTGGVLDAAVAAVTRGRTAIIVAHRFAQAATADRIVVMEHGRIVQHGSHADLLLGDGPYARLHTAASQNA